MERLQDAVVRRRRVRLAYAGRTGPPSERLVDPWGLVDKDDVWYLVAGTDRGQRTFRVDRVVEAEVTELAAERPEGFSLDAAWDAVVGEVEQRRSQTWATLRIEARFVPILRDHFGRHLRVDEHPVGAEPPGEQAAGEQPVPGGWARVHVAAPTALDLARNLAGWGAAVEVLHPPEVRAELGRIGRELSGRYDDAPA